MRVTQLRDELVNNFNDLKAGKINPKEAKEFANVAGKILSSAKLELSYNVSRNYDKKIDFLE